MLSKTEKIPLKKSDCFEMTEEGYEWMHAHINNIEKLHGEYQNYCRVIVVDGLKRNIELECICFTKVTDYETVNMVMIPREE